MFSFDDQLDEGFSHYDWFIEGIQSIVLLFKEGLCSTLIPQEYYDKAMELFMPKQCQKTSL